MDQHAASQTVPCADEDQDRQHGSRSRAEEADVDSEDEAALDELLNEARRQSGSR